MKGGRNEQKRKKGGGDSGDGKSQSGDGKSQWQCIKLLAVYYRGIPVCGYQCLLSVRKYSADAGTIYF